MELAETASGDGPLTLQDVINFAAACEHLGMRPADIQLSGGVGGWKARLTGHGALNRIVATGDKLPTSTWTPTPVSYDTPTLTHDVTATLVPGIPDKP